MRSLGVFVGILLMVSNTGLLSAADSAAPWAWESVASLAPQGRFDAITHLGRGVVIVGSRESDPGHLFQSRDYGHSWQDLGRPIGGAVLCLLALNDLTVLASTLDGHVWKSKDQGKTWTDRGPVGSRRIYSLASTANGSILAAEYNETGGRIFKSTDRGDHWDRGRVISQRELYRLQPVRDGVLVNGEAGHLYKSVDNGNTWTDVGELSAAPLYPIEALPKGVTLLGDAEGKIFRSEDDGDHWKMVQSVDDALDDFVFVENGLVFLSAYDGKKHLYRSTDSGVSWQDIGATPDGDVLDHAILLRDVSPPIAIGGTTQGRIIRARKN